MASLSTAILRLQKAKIKKITIIINIIIIMMMKVDRKLMEGA